LIATATSSNLTLFFSISHLYHKKFKCFICYCAASAYQPGCFFADRMSAMLGSIRIDAAGCSSLICEKGHGAHIPVAPCHNRHPGVAIPSSRLAIFKSRLLILLNNAF